KHHGTVYQIIGDVVPASGTNVVLYLENEHNTSNFTITHIRIQALDLSGGKILPSTETYFQFGFGPTYTSGGTDIKNNAVNVNRSSANTANITAYDNDPTLTGTFSEIDRWYVTNDESMTTFNKHGSIIIPKNKAFICRFITDNSAGLAYCRSTFMFLSK
ncbi:hypothetical protein LCGC14_1498730, partial [marine sediment metagenome]